MIYDIIQQTVWLFVSMDGAQGSPLAILSP